MQNTYFTTFFLFLFGIFTSVGQQENTPEFNFEDYRFPKSIVNNVDNLASSEIKTKTQSWIDSYFTENQIRNIEISENEINISGLANRLISVKNLTTDVKFDVKISFRNNKYKLEIISLYYKYYTEFREVSNIKFIKDDIIRKDLERSKSSFTSFFNDLNKDLHDYLMTQNSSW